eukprot:Transcript_17336.p1 GENE.Transcript_17336~~Transcript_17336.p1  ORF type:complete len:657 (+),score=48.73 Transcript_17336:119-2089(+)
MGSARQTAANGGMVEQIAAASEGAAGNLAAPPTMTVLTYATSNYVHWLDHLHRNLLQLQLRKAWLVVCVSDNESLRAAQDRGLRTISTQNTSECPQCSLVPNVLGVATSRAETFGSKAYAHVVHSKSICINLHLAQHELSRSRSVHLAENDEMLLFVDADVTLFSDPRPLFPMGVDIALLVDIGPWLVGNIAPECGRQIGKVSAAVNYFNSGFFMMRYSEKTRRLWRMMLAYHRDRPGVLQQPALNQLLRGATVAKLAIRVQGLNESKFLSGFCFYEQRPLSAHNVHPDKVVAVHHNWIRGDAAKYARAREYDAVVDAGPGLQRGFVARARASMAIQPAWTAYAEPGPRNCTLLPQAHGSRELTVCRRSGPPRLCAKHAPVALWSFPGSGSTWLRLVIEIATGGRTGSIHSTPVTENQTATGKKRQRAFRRGSSTGKLLAAKMPSEFWPHDSRADCAGMVALAVHGLKGLRRFEPPWVKTACGGALGRAVLLVRHPFLAVYADLRHRGSAKNFSVDLRWHNSAVHMATLWAALVAVNTEHVDWSFRLWSHRRPSLLVRYEDLKTPERRTLEVRRLLSFVFEGERPPVLKIRCALKRATQMQDEHRRNAPPIMWDRERMRRALENSHFRTADEMWAAVAEPAMQLDYARSGYESLPL